ncbi:PAS domain-containing protein [Robiginitalea sp. M366]|uniref:sensor histidine kinase n=1 Tax=Robiginitalea aestuariiviva TaxID=3036903 RepID=UPI00240D0629|nr:PAS domain-containing protein [Robiginitalea aestuariiviva]MDG1571942.1 PAS domain-containing protein [Robiginitalea aestuariiviva]
MKTLLNKRTPLLLKNIRTTSLISFLIVLLAVGAQLVLVQTFLNQRDGKTRSLHLIQDQAQIGQDLAAGLLALRENTLPIPEELQKRAADLDSLTEQLRANLNSEADAGLDSTLAFHTQRASALSNLARGDPASRDTGNITGLQTLRKEFLSGTNALEAYFEQESARASSRLRFLVIGISGLLLLLVMALHFFLVNPMTQSLKRLSHLQRQQRLNLTATLENTKDLVWSVNRDFRLIMFNSAFYEGVYREHGFYPEHNTDMGQYMIISKSEDRKLYRRAFNGESFSIEHRNEATGVPYYYEYSFNPILDEDGQVLGCSVFRRDETQRIQTIKDLEKSQFYLNEAQRIARIGNWNWDMVTDRLTWSRELYHIFGQDPATFQASYQALLDMIHPEDLQSFEDSVRNSIEQHIPHDMVHRIILPSGEIRYIHEKGFVLLDDGKPVRMAGTAQDVTKLENAKNEILRQNKELQNFVYIISHNVRSPIATIQGLVDLFEDGDSEVNRQLRDQIAEKVEVLDGTIKDLNHALSLQNTAASSYEDVSLTDVVREVEQLLEQDLRSTNTTLEVDFSKLEEVSTIRSYMSNILYNLILNAISYRHPDRSPRIAIGAQHLPEAGEIQITVADNGIGMQLDDARIEKIFSMYGRLSGSTSGKGLGLFLVKSQVEALKGRISVESAPGEGSRFIVYLKLEA